MDTRQFYLENGYVILKSAYSAEELTAVWNTIDKIFQGQMEKSCVDCVYDEKGRLTFASKIALYEKDREAYISCMRTSQNIPALMAMGNSEKLISLLSEMGISTPVFSTKPIFTLMSPYTSANYTSWKMPPHQDWRSIQGSLNNVVAWVALTDVNDEVGPIEVIPKSHLKGLLEVEKDDWYYKLKQDFSDEEYESVPLDAGDCVIFSSFLVHRSGTNKSQHLARASVQFRYNDIQERSFIERGYPSTYGSDRPEKDYVKDDGITVLGEDVVKAL